MSEEKKKSLLSRIFGRDKPDEKTQVETTAPAGTGAPRSPESPAPQRPADVPPPEEAPKPPPETPDTPKETPGRPDENPTPAPAPEVRPDTEPDPQTRPVGVPPGPSEAPVSPDEAPDAPAEAPPIPDEPEIAPGPDEEIPPKGNLAEADPGPPETTPEWIEAQQQSPAPVGEPDFGGAAKKSWFHRLRSGLKRSSDNLTGNIASVFTRKRLDQATLDDLEDILIQADLGITTATRITEALARDRFDKQITTEDVRQVLAGEIEKALTPVAQPLSTGGSAKPFVILMVGVNGSGKTTTIGKMAQKFGAEGKSVMLAAGDTFRAAAIEQLQIWGERTGVPVIARPTGSDASGLAFDAVSEAKRAGTDILIIDTAGRLQNRDELMAELEKVIRVIRKVDDTAPHAVLLTLDATTGQNALSQVEIFGKRAGVTGLVMTKLDGTARGGILVAIAQKFALPVHYIGVGEGVDDLESFAAADFAEAIAGRDEA